ncbi:MAG: phage virion morphogenesis protein [Spirochaetota bacterium]
MAGFSITIDDSQVNALLDGMSGFKLLDLARIAGTELKKIADEAFEKKTDPVTGKAWEPSGNGDTLYRTGDLKRSVTWDASGRGELLSVGSNKEYARIHQEGGRAGRGKKVTIPQRRFLGAPEGWAGQLLGMPQVKKLLGVDF